jgi:G3E family GTPase
MYLQGGLFMKKVLVYLLSGFLGSGKTTVLLNMLKHCKESGKKAGIILNELGDINVETHLFESERIFELLNGCICCSIQEDLKSTLDEFLHKNEKDPVDVLLIEGTGVANPLEIKDALHHPKYIDHFSLQSIISLVDASHFFDYQSIFSSSREVRKLLKEQITYANVIILNKIDLVSAKKLEKIENKLKEMAGHDVPILKTTFGEVPIDELFAPRMKSVTIDGTRQEEFMNHHHHHDHHHSHHNHATIQAVKIENVKPFQRIEFEKWLKGLPNNIFRGKGIIQFDETPGFFEFQYSSKQFSFNRIHSVSKVQPVIILIGNDMDVDHIMNEYKAYFY